MKSDHTCHLRSQAPMVALDPERTRREVIQRNRPRDGDLKKGSGLPERREHSVDPERGREIGRAIAHLFCGRGERFEEGIDSENGRIVMHIEEDLTQMTESELWVLYDRIDDERRAHRKSRPDVQIPDNKDKIIESPASLIGPTAAWYRKFIELDERIWEMRRELERRWHPKPCPSAPSSESTSSAAE